MSLGVALLFTACALICALVAVLAARVAVHQAAELVRRSREITSLQHHVDALEGSLHKVRQKVYSLKPEKQESEIARNDALLPGNVIPCDNWLAAQTEGPTSKAARCDCAYCEAQRAARARTRATLLPHALEKAKRNS